MATSDTSVFRKHIHIQKIQSRQGSASKKMAREPKHEQDGLRKEAGRLPKPATGICLCFEGLGGGLTTSPVSQMRRAGPAWPWREWEVVLARPQSDKQRKEPGQSEG